jgi:C4-dicarboxylate transporter DctM subunit
LPLPVYGAIGLALFLLLAMLGVPLAFSFMSVGFIGLMVIQGFFPGLSILGSAPYSWTASYTLCTIPLFVLMGQFVFYSGISRGLYVAAYKWMGKLPGGLALATTLACTAFAACTGSSMASAATMGTIAYPEMKKLNYDDRLSTGCIAVGGTLGILIPPSTIFIVYGVVTETSIGKLFIAGILPGLMLSLLFLVTIYIWAKRNSKLAPLSSESFSLKDKLLSLSGVWGVIALFVLVVGGLYIGIFTPSEAGGIGAFGAFIIALLRRSLTRSIFFSALQETVQTTCFALFVLIGAMIFSTFLAITELPAYLVGLVTDISVSPVIILMIICAFYIPLGCFIDALPMVLLTMPIVFPIVKNLGADPVWFGVMVCVLAELSLVTPPVGLNLYVVQGVTKVSLQEVVKGIAPFLFAFLIALVLLFAFPQISLFLPAMMK